MKTCTETLTKTLQEHEISFSLNHPLAKYTTWKIGGPASFFISPESETQLQVVLQTLHELDIPWFILGKGSNLLIKDTGFSGAVIKLGKAFDTFRVEGQTVYAKGGCSLVKLSLQVSKLGLSGLEFIGGVPGTVGGGICMNAGAHGSDMSHILKEVRVMKENGEIITLQKEDLHFSYRNSMLFQTKWIVLEAAFSMKAGDKTIISKKQAELKEYRMRTQPLKEKSCGSVFTNPLPNHAGQLIESCGLKGYRIGGAMISDKHANFIVNVENASAEDVLALIQKAQETIKEQYGIDLHPEVKVIG